MCPRFGSGSNADPGASFLDDVIVTGQRWLGLFNAAIDTGVQGAQNFGRNIDQARQRGKWEGIRDADRSGRMLSDPERGFYQTVGKAIVPLRVAGGMVSDFAQGVWHLPGAAYDLVPFGSPATLPMALYNRQPGAPNPMRILGPLTQLSSERAGPDRLNTRWAEISGLPAG